MLPDSFTLGIVRFGHQPDRGRIFKVRELRMSAMNVEAARTSIPAKAHLSRSARTGAAYEEWDIRTGCSAAYVAIKCRIGNGG